MPVGSEQEGGLDLHSLGAGKGVVREVSEFYIASSLPFPGGIYFTVPGTPQMVKLEKFTFFLCFFFQAL